MIWFVVGLAVVALVYFFGIKPFTYWTSKSVPQAPVYKHLIDNFKMTFQLKAQADVVKDVFSSFPKSRYVGSYQFFQRVLFLKDPDLIKQITVKDFDRFTDHDQFISEEAEPLWSKNLFALKGEKWKDMRATLSPSFTSSKMKAMFGLITESAEQFIQHFRNESGDGAKTVVVEMKDAFTRFSNDVIATIAFGIPCNSLKDRDNEFYTMGKEATNFKGLLVNLKFVLLFLSPKLSELLGVTLFSAKVSAFFRKLVKENVESREKNGIVRPDMIHLLMEARNGRLKHEEHANGTIIDSGFAVIEESAIGKEEKRQKRQLTDDDLTAQALIFFFAGFDSVSTLMCFLVYELAVHPEIQQSLRDEIEDTLKNCGGKLTYEALLKMKYLDMVISETLRKWPTAIAVDRVCVKPYTIEAVNGDEKPIDLKPGDLLWLPIYGIHRCPDFYPDPERFDPERFNDENKNNIYPYSYLPFGAGPRSCIGNRFALLETKIIIFYILSNFELTVVEKTPIPFKLAKNQFNLTAANGFWVGLKPLKVK